jgi:hypothetical protein
MNDDIHRLKFGDVRSVSDRGRFNKTRLRGILERLRYSQQQAAFQPFSNLFVGHRASRQRVIWIDLIVCVSRVVS